MISQPTSKRKLLAAERQQRILERVATEGAVKYQRLADELGVSVMTVRRDLKELVDQGFVTVTRGGASAYLARSPDRVENPRSHEQAAEKIQVGAFAARHIEHGEVILLGTGSTTGAFAQFLDPDAGLHVVTTSLSHATYLAARGIEVTCLGGTVIPNEMSTTGALTLEGIEHFHATTAVVGTRGIARDSGLTEERAGLSEVSRAMLAASARSMLLIDSTKVGIAAPYRIGPIEAIDLVVTSAGGLDRLQHEAGDLVEILAAPAEPSAEPVVRDN